MQTGDTALEKFESALKNQGSPDLDFKVRVEQALGETGGGLLFHMRMDGMSGCDEVAAVVIDSQGRRIFALAILPAGGGALRVEEAGASDIPVAQIAAAYSGVLESLAA